MAPSPPRLRILSVGGNAVSAFLSWRLQATNACDVTLVWKSGFEQVSQYGISFKSKQFGNERFKPFNVVRAPEDAANPKAGFDYVLLCVKALPDVYDLAGIIESVVTPQHTCILINTTNSLGIETHLEERFPTNVVLSLVSGAELQQLGPSEFEHIDSTDVWVGAANKNPSIPASIQSDMAEALAMTLLTGQVDCKVSPNIRQQQYGRMIGPIAFHPLSVLFETPNHAELIDKIGVRTMISDIIDELLQLAILQGCAMPPDYKNQTIDTMIKPSETNTVMYQDFIAKRPMEIETFLGSPIKLAQAAGIRIPRIETLYSIIHNINIVNQSRPAPSSSPPPPMPMGTPSNRPPPRMSSANYGGPGPGPRPMNGMPNGMQNGNRSRAASMVGGPPPPPRRGGPNGVNSRGPQPGQWRGGPPAQISRRPSFENGDLGEEFSHLALIDNIPEGEIPPGGYSMGMSPNEIDLRERELALKQRELQIREREMGMGKGRRGPPPRNSGGRSGGFDDDDDDDDYFDPMFPQRPVPHIDPDNFDMMSVTSRKNRKAPSASQFRKNPDAGNGGGAGRGGFFRPQMARNRSSQQLLNEVPTMGANIMADPLMGYSSNRYGTVDRKEIASDQRTDSLTREKLDQLAGSNMPGMAGAFPSMPRRISVSPAETFIPNGRRQSNRPSPPGGFIGADGRPSPPGMMRQPVPRYPPGQGNAVAPQQVEQYAGVSKQHPYNRPPQVRSLTGSASASAGSGESALIDSENSAHSSQSSFAPRPPIGVR